MNTETEDILWLKFIKIGKDIESFSANIHLDKSTKKKEQFFSLYNKYKQKVKENIFPDNPGDPENLLDRHKLASIFYAIIIKLKYLEVEEIEEYQIIEKTANEQAGIMFGLHLVSMFSSVSSKRFRLIELPDCNHGGSYLANLIKLLHKNKKKYDIENDEFDINHILYLSHIFFLLEKYTEKTRVRLSSFILSLVYLFIISLVIGSYFLFNSNLIKIIILIISLSFLFFIRFIDIKTPFSLRKILKGKRF